MHTYERAFIFGLPSVCLQVTQSVRYTCLESCYHWHGDTKLVYEIAYGTTTGIYASGSYLLNQLLHTDCSSTGAGSVDIAYAVTVLASKVADVQTLMNNLTSNKLASTIAATVQSTTTTGSVTVPSESQVLSSSSTQHSCNPTRPFSPPTSV